VRVGLSVGLSVRARGRLRVGEGEGRVERRDVCGGEQRTDGDPRQEVDDEWRGELDAFVSGGCAQRNNAEDAQQVEHARAEHLARADVLGLGEDERGERHRELGKAVAGRHDGGAQERAWDVEDVGRRHQLQRRHIPLLDQHVHHEDGVREEAKLEHDAARHLEVEEVGGRSALCDLGHRQRRIRRRHRQ
jgi:hypothetical protein